MENYYKEKKALEYALKMDFSKLLKFELYRRKDNRNFRFIVYDGKNYEELYRFLQNNDEDIIIPIESKLKTGVMYNINGENKFIKIDKKTIDAIIAGNSYVVKKDDIYFQAFNYDIAKWLLINFPGIYLKNLIEINNQNRKSEKYNKVEMLEMFPDNSCYKTDNVWILPNRLRNNDIDINNIPIDIIENYSKAKDCYQEYEVFENEGLKGIRFYGYEEVPLLQATYQDIILENYRAYIKNETGKWAEFSLTQYVFKSDFIYSDIEVDVQHGYVAAYIDGRKIILHGKAQAKKQNIIFKDGYFGIEEGNKMILENLYDSISFYGGGYEVFKDGKYGIVDNNGSFVLECEYDNIIIKDILSPLYQACKDGLWGVVGKNIIYQEFCDEMPNDEKYEDTINSLINKCYKQHRLINTIVKHIDKEHGIIYMKLKDFDREFKVKKYQLPENVYNEIISSYIRALYHLGKSALKINDKGNIQFCYADKVKWINYWKKLEELKEGNSYKGHIYKLTSLGAIVLIDNGVYGKMKLENKSLELNDYVSFKVVNKDKNDIYLEYIDKIE